MEVFVEEIPSNNRSARNSRGNLSVVLFQIHLLVGRRLLGPQVYGPDAALPHDWSRRADRLRTRANRLDCNRYDGSIEFIYPANWRSGLLYPLCSCYGQEARDLRPLPMGSSLFSSYCSS